MRNFCVLFAWLCVVAFGAVAQDRGVSGTTAAPGTGPQKWAVVIGVGAYEDAAFTPLPNAVRDATALRDLLVSAPGGFPADNVLLLTDNNPSPVNRPTRSGILAGVGRWAGLAGAEDSLLVYFAGHGVEKDGKLYLMPLDARSTDLTLTGVPYADFESQLGKSAAKRAIVILDACHSGSGRSTPTMTRGMEADIEKYSEGRITLASCRVDELSHEYDGNHGAFTWFLMEGLQGAADANADGSVSALEASNYTFEKVRRWAAQKGLQQTPRLLSNISGDIVLAKVHPVTAGQPQRPPAVVSGGQPQAGEVRVFEGGEFAWIPPGTFEMGSRLSGERVAAIYGGDAKYYQNEKPHQVTLSKGYWLATKEVSNREFEVFVKATRYQTDAEKSGTGWTYDPAKGWVETKGATWRKPGWNTKPAEPVVLVSWNDAVAYCQWLSSKTGEGYRLPTEAEWEYACRAGTTTQFFWGDQAADGQGYLNGADETKLPDGRQWEPRFPFTDGYFQTAPVGSFKPNPWGLYDMHGNVNEWCQDWYGDYPSGAVTDPVGPLSGQYRVLRGGSWYATPALCRSADRSACTPALRYHYLGFRLLRTQN